MRAKSYRQSEVTKGRGPGGVNRDRSSVVPALIITAPDLTLYSNLQNLLSYCLECVNSLARSGGSRDVVGEQFFQCVSHIERLCNDHKDSVDEEIVRLLIEFIEEAVHVRNLVRGFNDDQANSEESPDRYHPLGLLLTAKASRLQWLTVCLLEELKKPFSR